ncbi:hypothetical protein SeLEV6574_g06269 [Synchytrium endobioticum]|uniref:PH domain-containing protein n=1 Tax=Synchytrium endobioticum TaxID=286115 RepID=A0A507CPK1_9FUNG|nr:hypothetical protein SeLEV6574_g06269 [Synchytrium endobioticum]
MHEKCRNGIRCNIKGNNIDLTNVDCIEIIEDGGRKRMSVKLENSHVWTLQTLSEVSLSYWIKNLLDLAAYWRARHIINMKTEREITSTVKTPSPPQQEKSAIPVTAFKQRIKQFEMQVMQEQNYAYQLWPWCLYSGCYSIIKTGILFVKLQNQHIFMARHCVLTTTHFILLRPARRYKTWLRKHDTISIPLPSPSSDSHVFVMSGKGPVVDTWFKEIEEGKHVEHFSVFWYIGVERATQCGRSKPKRAGRRSDLMRAEFKTRGISDMIMWVTSINAVLASMASN